MLTIITYDLCLAYKIIQLTSGSACKSGLKTRKRPELDWTGLDWKKTGQQSWSLYLKIKDHKKTSLFGLV
jgi:hypothetical protein